MERQDLDEMLETMDTYKEEFYLDAIALHEDEKLRSIVEYHPKGQFTIIKGANDSYSQLYYSNEGFVAGMPKYCDGGWDDYGYYKHDNYTFGVKDDMLVVSYKGKKQELLELFPKVSVKDITQGIEAEINKLDIYKKAIGTKTI